MRTFRVPWSVLRTIVDALNSGTPVYRWTSEGGNVLVAERKEVTGKTPPDEHGHVDTKTFDVVEFEYNPGD